MATYDLEEHEKLEELKTWWKMHGNFVTVVLAAVALALLAWQGWNWWQRSQAGEASALYMAVQQAAADRDAKRARDIAGELIDKYSRTPYAGLAALLSAQLQAEGGDARNARVQLEWAAANASDEAVRDLARLRFAALLLDDKGHDEALKQLAATPAPAFVPRYEELKGDVFAAQGKPTEAKGAYQTALDKMDELARTGGGQLQPYRQIVQTKLDSLGSVK